MWALVRYEGTDTIRSKELQRGENLEALYAERDRLNRLAVDRHSSLTVRRHGVLPVGEER